MTAVVKAAPRTVRVKPAEQPVVAVVKEMAVDGQVEPAGHLAAGVAMRRPAVAKSRISASLDQRLFITRRTTGSVSEVLFARALPDRLA